jgi:hypothetical protein
MKSQRSFVPLSLILLWLIGLHFLLFHLGPLMAGEESKIDGAGWKQLMEWEFKANGVAKDRAQSEAFFVPQFFLLPVSQVNIFHAPLSEQDPAVHELVEVEKEGKAYVRWFINPEDTLYHTRLQSYLERMGEDGQLYKLEGSAGHKSASRSSLLQPRPDSYPERGAFFKASTNSTGGLWTDQKSLKLEDVKDSMAATEISERVSKRLSTGNLVLLKEPLAMTFKQDPKAYPKLDHGIVFRSFGNFPQNGMNLLPGFSVLEETEGRRLAALNEHDPDANDPAQYWMKHFAAPTGKALADFIFTHHLSPTSFHSQQVLVELDSKKVPTGKIFMRDFNDSELLKFLWMGNQHKDLIKNWSETINEAELNVSFGLFHGSKIPSWLGSGERKKWREAYLESFEKRFADLLNISVHELRLHHSSHNFEVDHGASKSLGILAFIKNALIDNSLDVGDGYNRKTWPLMSPIFLNWIAAQDCFKGFEKTERGLHCDDVLDCFRGDNLYSRNQLVCTDVMTALLDPSDINTAKVKLKGIIENKLKHKQGGEGEEVETENRKCRGNPYLLVRPAEVLIDLLPHLTAGN